MPTRHYITEPANCKLYVYSEDEPLLSFPTKTAAHEWLQERASKDEPFFYRLMSGTATPSVGELGDINNPQEFQWTPQYKATRFSHRLY